MAILFLVSLIHLSSSVTFANEEIITISEKTCQQGIMQPAEGPFGVFLFCDGSLGAQIGIVMTKPGASEHYGWTFYNRFWQEGNWMKDVREMVWSETGNYLYVITSEVYSEEALWELDLLKRKTSKLLDGKDAEGYYLSFEIVNGQTTTVNGKQFEMKE